MTSVVAVGVAPAAAAPGDPDPTYGTTGTTDLPGGAPDGVVTDATGTAWATTVDTGANPPTVSITRLQPDGLVDPTYGTAGTATSARRGLAHPDDVRTAVDAEGRVVIASIEETGATLHLVVRRLLANGTPDPSFGTDGTAPKAPLPSTIHDIATVGDVVVLPTGTIAVPVTSTTVDVNAGVARHTTAIASLPADGSVFGGVILDAVDEPRANGFPLDRLALGSDGAVYHAVGRNGTVQVRRFDAALQQDQTFGTDGVATIARPDGAGIDTATRAVVLRPSPEGTYVAADVGRDLGAGALETTGTFIARLRGDGATDPAWGFGGPVPIGAGGFFQVVDLVTAPDGDVLLLTRGPGLTAVGMLHQFRSNGTTEDALGGSGTAPIANHTPSGPVALVGGRLLVNGRIPGGATAAAVKAYEIPGAPVVDDPGAVLVPVDACRVLDTRLAGPRVGRTIRAVAVRPDDRIAAQGGDAAGCGIPAEASAVVAAVTAVNPSTTGYLRVGAGAEQAPATTLITYAGASVTNVGPLTLGTGPTDLGVLAMGGTTDLVIDVLAYYVPRSKVAATDGSVFVPITPCRVYDDRVAGDPVVSGVTRTIELGGDLSAQGGSAAGCDLPAEATAVEAALSSVTPTRGGHARLGPAGPTPRATVLNVTSGRSIAATPVVEIGTSPATAGPALDLRVNTARSSWVVIVTGYYLPRTAVGAPTGGYYHAATPCRLADTRRAGGPVGGGARTRVIVAADGPTPEFAAQGGTAAGCGVPTTATAVVATISAADALGSGETRVSPAGTPTTGGTLVHFRKGASASGSRTMGLADGAIDVRTYVGPTNQVVDLRGWFD